MANLREVSIQSLLPAQDNSEVLEAIKTLAAAIKPTDNTEVVKMLASLVKSMPGEISKIQPQISETNLNLAPLIAAMHEKEVEHARTYIFDIQRDGHGKIKRVVATPE